MLSFSSRSRIASFLVGCLLSHHVNSSSLFPYCQAISQTCTRTFKRWALSMTFGFFGFFVVVVSFFVVHPSRCSRFPWSRLVLPRVLSRLFVSCRVVSCRVLSCLASCLVVSCLVLSCRILSCVVLSSLV
jgi:hypothetical protein